MNKTTAVILDEIKTWIWSGFCTPQRVDEIIDDLLEDGADEAALRAAVLPEFARKSADEVTWPAKTDCDRLDDAFTELESRGIIALHNAGFEMSDGILEVTEVVAQETCDYRGYCFYHGQDLEHAVNGGGLWIAFGALGGSAQHKVSIGEEVQQSLQRFGLNVEWDGDPEMRIIVPRIDWKRRGQQSQS